MELHREIRAFYLKIPTTTTLLVQDIVDGLWESAKELSVSAIDANNEGEVVIHAEIQFSLKSWNSAIGFLRAALGLTGAKSGYMLVRKIIASKNAVRTEIENYKVTRRGVYNAELPDAPDFIEDVVKLSGRNKRLQQIDAMEKLFRFIEEQENEDTENEA